MLHTRIPAALLLALISTSLVAQDELADQEERAVKSAVAKVAPSVVRIETFGGLEKVGQLLVGTGPTTGLIVSEDGLVISSAFNFVQKPASILVTLANGKRAAATIVAHDRARMLVLLKLNTTEKLPVPVATPREEMFVGQWAIALGRTYESEKPSMSVGIVSALDRVWGKAIQADAKISPANYGGPLVDIRGRVLGVLVPLSAQSTDEVAGSELYDSGIGFAVPLADIQARLGKLREGKDLHAGIFGISMKGTDMFADGVEITAVQPNSPAYAGGFKAGDKIIEADGKPVGRQAQLKHALGPHYAGDKVRIVAMRKDQRIEATVELAEKVDPFEHPFLGVLPLRNREEKPGLSLRYVFPGSPAAEAGLKAQDRILAVGDKPVTSPATLQDAVALWDREKEKKITLKVEREGKPLDVVAGLATLPTNIPSSLPPAHDPLPAANQRPPVGVIDIKIPEEEKNECFAFVPDTYHPNVPHGLVVWLHEPGTLDKDALIARWKPLCEQHDLILLAPKPADAAKWLPTEAAFVRKTIDDVSKNYNIDPTRVVTYGYKAGGSLAFLVAFANRDVVRGLVAIEAAVPARSKVPDNDPLQRLAVYTATIGDAKLVEAIKAGVKKFKDAKFPITVKDLGDKGRDLNKDELAELARWIDTLDRS